MKKVVENFGLVSSETPMKTQTITTDDIMEFEALKKATMEIHAGLGAKLYESKPEDDVCFFLICQPVQNKIEAMDYRSAITKYLEWSKKNPLLKNQFQIVIDLKSEDRYFSFGIGYRTEEKGRKHITEALKIAYFLEILNL